ncbi:YggT family protein [Shewanella algae]|uniref:YggT family protein n=1 Tax=Shewanella algae TaxID=38313 RepID=UPI001021A5DB|nr:YggT family protein [Shewanella algae]MBO2577198.1 YggT family protein [Shewanella algae]MBO2602706.1 YggT family protein [Shewanella algae]MBO2682741.1 YggT family protein [Shewanella algae]MCE9779913.1 YggT family protein [Shewanella algae]MCE9825038.1 YggT family protein [Shewanella algae]
MNDALNYLITVVFDLYFMVVILRIWLQLVRADFYNPFSQFIVKATHPIVAPMRRILPSIGSLDTASVVLALLVVVVKRLLLTLMAGEDFNLVATLIFALVSLFKNAGVLLFWILIIRAILSWVSQGRNPIEYVMMQLTEPLLAPIRRFLPPMGGLDLSLLVLMVLMNFVNILLAKTIPFWAIA